MQRRRTRTVWMVNALTGMGGEKGTLALEPDAVVFRPEVKGSGETSYELSSIGKAKRVRGTPVLELRLTGPDPIKVVGFYFVQPPSLEIPPHGSPFVRRRTMKKRALNALRGANFDLKQEVGWWAERIEEARRTRESQ